MDKILNQPLATFLGLRESAQPEFLLEVDYSAAIKNHFNSFHASALFGFAEYSAGAFLVRHFPNHRHSTLPMLRRAQVKYSAVPVLQTLFSAGQLVKTTIETETKNLDYKGRALFEIQISVTDSAGKLVFKGDFEWFIIKKSGD